MALPFPVVPVLIGAAIGAAVTYVLTTRSARKQITAAFEDAGDSLASGAKKATSTLSDAVEGATDAAKEVASNIKKK
jgi:hypothetical protein